MTDDEAPDLGMAHIRLDAAVQQLIQPTTEHVDRATAEHDPDVADLDAEHRRRTAELRGRHAALLRAGQRPQATRVLARLIAHEHQARARRTDRAELPSLLDQLRAAVAGTGGSNGAPGAGAHRSPIALGAAQLLGDIERTIRWGLTATAGRDPHPDTRAQLRAWAGLAGWWRTDHPAYLLAAAGWAETWVTDARALLNPPRRWSRPGMCPACKATIAHVRDETGELVRRPPLELDRTAVTVRCLACSTRWDEDKLPLLAAVLEEQDRELADEQARQRAARDDADARG